MGWLKKVRDSQRAFRALSVADRRILIEAWLDAIMVAFLLRSPWKGSLFPSQEAVTPTSHPQMDIPHTVQIVDLACAHHIKQMSCLERTLTAHRTLKRHGVYAQVRIGVRKGSENELEAHAWLEHPDLPQEALELTYIPLEPNQSIPSKL